MDKFVILLHLLGIGIFLGGLVGIYFGVISFGIDILSALVFLIAGITFTIIGIAWIWYVVKHFD